MKLYVEKNPYYSNYLRCQLLSKHLPYEVEFFEGFDPKRAKKADIVYFQTPFIYADFVSGPKYVWDLDDVLESTETNSPQKTSEIELAMRRCFASVDAVIFGSKLLQDHYKDWYGGKSIWMDDYIDPCDHALEGVKNTGKLKLCFHGSDFYVPEVEDIIETIKDLDVDLVVMGVNPASRMVIDNGYTHIPHLYSYDKFSASLANLGADIGIAYYRKDKEINLPKNHLKWSEFAWLRIPCLSSRWITGQFVPEEVGLHFDTLEELKTLIKSMTEAKMAKYGQLQQKYCRDHFSLHNKVKEYTNFLEAL